VGLVPTVPRQGENPGPADLRARLAAPGRRGCGSFGPPGQG